MGSIILYIGAFLISALTAHFIQRGLKKNNNLSLGLEVILSLLIMILPITISCFREGIGVDYDTYITVFTEIHENNINEYHANLGSWEILNKPIVDLGFFIFGSVNGVFALYAILTLTIFEMTLLNFRNYISLSVATLVLLLLLYSASLNIVRQSLSIAIIFYSIKFIINRQLHIFITLVIIATLIHSSAIIAILLYFLYFNKNNFKTNIVKLCILVTPLFVVTSLTLLSEFALFERYLDVYSEESIDITKAYIIKLPMLLLLLLSYTQLRKLKISNFLYLCVGMELILLFSASMFKWAFRLSYYPYIGQIMLLSMASKDGRTNALVIKFITTLWYILYFYVLFYLWGRDGIFPYKCI